MRIVRIAILAGFPIDALDRGASGRGGGQGCTWLPQLAGALESETDFEVHWLVLDRTGRGGGSREALGQTFHTVPAASFSADLLLNYLPARRALGKVLRRIEPDIVHAWGTELIYPAVLRDMNVPTVLSMQGVLTEYARIGGLPDDWRWRKMVRTEAGFMRSASMITSESQWGMDRVREIVPNADIRMVEYGVHPSFYETEWMPKVDSPYVLYVGGADRRKGADLLLSALEALPDRKWELKVAGDERLEAMVQDAGVSGVRCLGLLPWDEMKRELAGAWCTVLPTRGDTSPNSVKEARVIGVPVVTSRHGGQSGYIRDNVNGKIVDPLNAVNLAGALADVMGSYDRAVSLGKARHDEDRAYLHPDRTAEGFCSIYRELAGA